MKLDSDLMTQKAGAATVTADYSQAKLQSETDKAKKRSDTNCSLFGLLRFRD